MSQLISDTHFLRETCKIGQGKNCCRYLLCGSKGFECGKHSALKGELDARAASGSFSAISDNCKGLK